MRASDVGLPAVASGMTSTGHSGPSCPTRTIIVGDVHGCAAELNDLLLVVQARQGCDRLIFLGDLLGKGPRPLEVLHRARREIDNTGGELLLGNHEAAYLKCVDHFLSSMPSPSSVGVSKETGNGPQNSRTLSTRYSYEAHHGGRSRNYCAAGVPADALTAEELAWLRERPLSLRLPEHQVTLVHAGLDARLPLSNQTAAAQLTMRSIRSDGAPSSSAGNESWAATWAGPEHVIFGHDARRRLQRHAYATGIDTGVVYGGNLTALILPEWTLVQACRLGPTELLRRSLTVSRMLCVC